MPKHKKKNPVQSHNQNGASQNGYGSDDESLNDNDSLFSYQSEGNQDSTDGTEVEVDANEKYEDKLIQAMENATEKSAQTRTLALQAMAEILMQRYLPDFVDDRKITIMDLIEKSIKRGKGIEQAWGARLAALLIIQVGSDEEIIRTLTPVLRIAALDPSLSYDARAKCCLSLGLLNFLGNDDLGEIIELMKNFESIFCASYLKGDNSPSSAGAEAAALHSAALSAWGLLLTLLPPSDVAHMTEKPGSFPAIKNLLGLLRSAHLDVRVNSGELFALLYEQGRAHDDDYLEEYLPELINITRTLATDSHKYRAKRDRKTQRATFRDILHYFEEDTSPEINVRFGRESMCLDSWASHHQYTSFCNVMGPGINNHLAENEFLRDVLQLGAKLNEAEGLKKMTKAEKRFYNAEAFKARTKLRSKNRDKRSAVVN
uniref:CSON000481 protein n=1 Tax=Culicoides sonorensis TaxID=179676 RepID=A0A336K7T6_CULSO